MKPDQGTWQMVGGLITTRRQPASGTANTVRPRSCSDRRCYLVDMLYEHCSMRLDYAMPGRTGKFLSPLHDSLTAGSAQGKGACAQHMVQVEWALADAAPLTRCQWRGSKYLQPLHAQQRMLPMIHAPDARP